MKLSILYVLIFGIVLAVIINLFFTPVIDVAHAEPEIVATTPKEVMIEIVYNWTPERIEQEIRAVFPEDPETAVKVAKCESGLRPTAKGPTSDHGLFQVHAPSWDSTAKRLGYLKYKTDVIDNLKMARYIYDNADGTWRDWVCFTRNMI